MTFIETEKRAVEKFRARALHLTENVEDEFLIRWLRARDLDLDKAETMLRKCLEWRETQNVGNALQYAASEEVVKNVKWTKSGYDSEGRPIFVVPYGDWEIRQFIEKGLKNECFLHTRKILEEMRLAIEEKKAEGVTQFVVILDSAGLTFWKVAHLETVNTILTFFKEFEAYYPELLYRCYIINAPWVFSYIFNIVKPLMSMRTLRKVTIYDHGARWRKVLNEDLPSDSLPVEYNRIEIPVAP